MIVKASDVFALLQDGQPMTRAELAARSGLARSTVASRVDVLMRLGLVAPFGGARSTGGRPPSLLAINTSALVVAAIDLGATHARAALADLAGTILCETRADLDIARGPDEVLAWVHESIDEMLADQDRSATELAAIGIGLPGPVEHASGRPVNPPIMPGWDQYDVPAHLRGWYRVPVLVDNDVNIMALGEQAAHHPDVENLVFVKVSTGIGSGIISGGSLQRGEQGAAGDIGHVRLERAADVQCRCGNQGCLEAVAALPALAAALSGDGGPIAPTDVIDRTRSGDVAALQVVRQAGRDLGDVVAMMVTVMNPAVVVIGGTLAESGEHFLAGIREVVYQRTLPLATENLRIVTACAGERSGILGAAAMAIAHVLSPRSIDEASLALGPG